MRALMNNDNNDEKKKKKKYMFMFSLKKIACKGLSHCGRVMPYGDRDLS